MNSASQAAGRAILTLTLCFALAPTLAHAQAQRSGEYIVSTQCAKCHGSGVAGAPKIGDREAWSTRVKAGVDPLVRSAIKGHGAMPSRGGMADLTDPEIRDAVIYMVTRSIAP
jgi:cytochrome c5